MLAAGVQLHQVLGHLPGRLPHLAFGAAPFLGPQLIQLGICGGILLDHIQTGCQHIKGTPVPVLNLDVILYHLLHFHLLNSLVNPKPVVFVHHVIPDFQLVKIIDLTTFISFFLFFLLFVRTEDITFRDHRKFQQRIFKALQHPAVKGHNLARLQLPVRVLRVKSGKPLVTQVLCKPCRPGPGTGQEKYPVTVFPVTL